MKKNVRRAVLLIGGTAVLALAAVGTVRAIQYSRRGESHSSMGFAMSTVITQTAYGVHAEAGMDAVTHLMAKLEAEFSLYDSGSEIAAINAAAGKAPVSVSERTLSLLGTALSLSGISDGKFQITIAPLTELWGITTDSPHVPSQQELDAVLPLIDDASVQINDEDKTVFLPTEGQAIDLGGIAKGFACDEARQAYLDSGVTSALLSIGGNVCAVGSRPDGKPFRIGFRDPEGDEESYIASFELSDAVIAVSGGYERYFVQDGVTYHHILDPETGFPAKSDIVSVGVVGPNGTVTDFWSTTLFCWGRDKTLKWMRTSGLGVLMLDDQGTLYVSQSLQEGFRNEVGDRIQVQFVEAGT